MRLAGFLGFLAVLASTLLAACAPAEERGPVVLAASSMQGAIEDAASSWAAKGRSRPVLSFASSAAVARQVSEGAPADVAITADAQWMDWLEGRNQLRAGTRQLLAGNRLVLVTGANARAGQASYSSLQEALDSADGPVAIAEPASVPAGRYARAAMRSLGLWDEVQDRLVPAENVRAALALVERGEADFGFVYASDAAASEAVRVIASVDASLHPPIRYPVAVLAGSAHPDSADFAAYLLSDEGQAILRRHGFADAS
ncbi:molybdate ABC transporter substrate-binding protein [Aurantiacibacter poecillastricola]|uniref:molybdate ABC transporter substrate-binding protein n=1 Tax=Aurantiacibacter poecillastricola TaxID=3064385 RepID=UPI00273F6129|nr:molybdate ABC transporter substrate-binding protein [Aurantiacibacter sp. 219JJ12-13]MDP5261135.1 molybdate ABC transporter substrate-binding protein [Aurantiacibacter sp. 219JJ12-13]